MAWLREDRWEEVAPLDTFSSIEENLLNASLEFSLKLEAVLLALLLMLLVMLLL